MAVTCSQCGEELLGSVNRCWRCGAAIESVAGSEGLPPIRRAPLADASSRAAPQGEAATVVQPTEASDQTPPANVAAERSPLQTGEPAEASATSGSTEPSAAELRPNEPAAPETPGPPIRRGSPFANSTSCNASPTGPIRSPYWDKPAYHQHSIAFAGAVASIVLGIMSLIASFITFGAVATAVLGMGLGVWGLNSNRRGTAALGLLLCCLSIGIAGLRGSVELYRNIHGHGPFESPPVIIDQ